MDDVLRALAAPHRREILTLIRDRELSAGAIAAQFDITRPAVSQHLGVLKQAGLVVERRHATRRLYRAEPQALAGVRVLLDDFWAERLDRLRDAAGGDVAPGIRREWISVEREIAIAAERDVVWNLLVDPQAATRWMGVSARFDPRPGGSYRVEVLPGLFAAGEFVELDAPRRLIHTWGWDLPVAGPVPPGSTIVIYELFDDGAGTRLRIRHRDLPGIATAGSHARGWAHYLERLRAVATGDEPSADPWITDPDRMRAELRPASGGGDTGSTGGGDTGATP